MLVTIKRQASPTSEPYYQTFRYDGEKVGTVSDLLDVLNYTDDLYDAEGHPAPRIRWECSCMQKTCGACAMLINKMPALACATFLRDIQGDKLLLEPLSKFPVVSDLMVDRTIIQKNLIKAEAYLGQYQKSKPKDYLQLYTTAKCLKCGLCLEACPNYTKGENFFGAVFANESFLLKKQTADRAKEIQKAYQEHFSKHCSKALSCVKVCPVGIDTITSIAKMNCG